MTALREIIAKEKPTGTIAEVRELIISNLLPRHMAEAQAETVLWSDAQWGEFAAARECWAARRPEWEGWRLDWAAWAAVRCTYRIRQPKKEEEKRENGTGTEQGNADRESNS